MHVDWINDPELDREYVTESTAQLLRKRMKCCKGLSYIATSNIVDSKWCPWALGYFDGISEEKCCMLPVGFYMNPYYDKPEYQQMVNLLCRAQEKWDSTVIDLYTDKEFNVVSEKQETLYWLYLLFSLQVNARNLTKILWHYLV